MIENNENDTDYIACYSTEDNFYEIQENGTFIVTVLANLEGKIPMKFIYNELYYNSSEPDTKPDDDDNEDEDKKENEDNNNAMLLVLLIITPIIIILIIVFIIILLKKNKQKEIGNLPEEKVKLVTDSTIISRNSNQE